MLRPFLLAAGLAFTAAVPAKADSEQLYLLVKRELHDYAPGVDARTLRSSQLAAIYAIMHSDDNASKKRSHIRSVIGGRLSLRGLLFN